MSEKRRLLNFVLSNSSWKDGRLIPGYRKPFDLLAVTNLAYQKEKALSPAKDGLFDIWLPGQALGDTLIFTPSSIHISFSKPPRVHCLPHLHMALYTLT
jgi:hypothetical protein